jgi:hypothetical protein
MSVIYTNSHLTIAATASQNDAEGLLRPLNTCLNPDNANVSRDHEESTPYSHLSHGKGTEF